MLIEQSFSRRRIESVIDNSVELANKQLREAEADAAALERAPDTAANRAALRDIERRIERATSNLETMQRFTRRSGLSTVLADVEKRSTSVPASYASADDDDPFGIDFENDWFYGDN